MSLVIDGRPPAFASPLHVGHPWTGSRARFDGIVDRVFREARFTNDGPCVREFESAIAALHGTKHCIALTNGTLAIQIALKTLKAEGEVIMPSFTFVGTAHAAAWIGLRPVFCDIDPATFTMDPEDLLRKITPATSCILPVNVFGNVCDFGRIAEIARPRGLRTLYDSAHCTGCAAHGVPVGGQGDLQILSFHATKTLHTFEGGAILTNDDALADTARLLRNYGFTGHERVACVGINAKMHEISAAYGLACLPDLSFIAERQRRNALAYEHGLRDVPGIAVQTPPEGVDSTRHVAVLLVDEAMFGLSRDAMLELLWAENIRARRYFAPGCHRLKPYADTHRGALPVTERLAETILCLPNDASLDAGSIAAVCEIIAEAGRRADEVRMAFGPAAHEAPVPALTR